MQNRAFLSGLIVASSLAVAAGCGGKVIYDPTGSGGAGGTASSTSTKSATSSKSSTSSANTTTTNGTSIVSTSVGPQVGTSVGPSTSTGISTCDTGMIGDPQSQLCNDCVNCAEQSLCASETQACGNNMECTEFINCVQNCQTQQCTQQCASQFPSGAMLYQAFVTCLLCSACPANCNIPQACPPNP
jgi:hypothetical protein